MEIIKQFFIKLMGGFVIGAGFILAAGLLGAYAINQVTSDIESKSTKKSLKKKNKLESLFRDFDENAKLTALVKKEKIGGGEFKLLGVVENKGEHAWSGINLKANLYNSSGEFIEQCEEYISGNIKPGKTINFKLACKSSNCNTVNINGYKSYKLLISNAHYVRPKSE